MDKTGIAICIMCLAVAGILGAWWWWERKRVHDAAGWPFTEATIGASALEVVASSRYGSVKLPVFSFDYQVGGQYYSGRFALKPFTEDPKESLLDRMIGYRLQVHYDPRHPQVWYVPEKIIEGCKVEQKMGPHVFRFYPRD